MKTHIPAVVALSLTVFAGVSAAADLGVSGRWDSDREATEIPDPSRVVNCTTWIDSRSGAQWQSGTPRGGFGSTPDLPLPRGPRSEFSLELKAGAAGRLSGSVTVRSIKSGQSVCVPTYTSNKFGIEDGITSADGKTFTFKLPADVNGVRIPSIWRGELLYPDTLRVRRETTSGAPADSNGDVLFHRPGPHPKVKIEGSVEIEGGGPVPRFDLTFFNTTPLRVPGPPRVNQTPPELLALILNQNGIAGRGGAPSIPTSTVRGSGFAIELPASDYRTSVTGVPSGFLIKSLTANGVDLLSDALKIQPDTRKVRIALVLGVASPPPWNKVSGRVGIPKASYVRLKGTTLAQELTAPISKDGSFEFTQVLPGAYTLTVAPSNVVGNITKTITVDTRGVAGIEILPVSARDMVGEFVKIQPGEFEMGCLPEDRCGQRPPPFGGSIALAGAANFGRVVAPVKPPVQQRIEKAFELGKHEVTQAQWERVMGKNPSAVSLPNGTVGPDFPVERVSWEDVQKFIGKLNKLNDGYRYRLPTGAEWEYAARAGGVVTQTVNAGLAELLLPLGGANIAGPSNAWHAGNSGGRSHRVGELPANAWGLHDMLGNVAEFVALEPKLALQNRHFTRGGSFQIPALLVSPALEARSGGSGIASVGFRLAREPVR